ncbi:MAG: PDZ domain-containing protein [Nocardioides sp.]|nr:PDZ domain-containing protein [Nocardioides sp.]
MTRRTLAIVIAVPLMVGLWLCAAFVPVPYVTYHPGVTVDILSEAGGQERVQVTGHKTYHDSGELRMTTVSVTSPEYDVSLFSAVESWLSDEAAVQPYSSVYEEGETNEASDKQSHAYMVTSQETAVAAALTEMGYDLKPTAEVAAVGKDEPASGVLKVKDRIVKVGSTAVSTPDQVIQAAGEATPGEPLKLVVVRDYDRTSLTVTPKDEDGKPKLGINVGVGLDLPFKVSLDINPDIGGPSAGLMFSLAVYDTLTPGSLTGGHQIAGTGTIDVKGTVGTIGGIQQKIPGARDAGAELFLVPNASPDSSNCDEAVGAANGDMDVVPVKGLHDAINVIKKWVDDPNADLPSCQDQE